MPTRTAAPADLPTRERIIDAARDSLLTSGFASLSTRRIAENAGVPLSQIHYHFGSKEQLVLAMLRAENDVLVARQTETFALAVPLADRWDLACDYLDDDLASGYVRVLQEMMAAGWSSPDVREAVCEIIHTWITALSALAVMADATVDLGPVAPSELVALVAAAFLGAEAMILLGLEDERVPIRRALRRVGEALRSAEGAV